MIRAAPLLELGGPYSRGREPVSASRHGGGGVEVQTSFTPGTFSTQVMIVVAQLFPMRIDSRSRIGGAPSAVVLIGMPTPLPSTRSFILLKMSWNVPLRQPMAPAVLAVLL